MYSEPATGDAWTFEAGAGARAPVGTRRSVRVGGRLRTNSSEVVREAVLSGMGIGYSPTWLFAEELASRRLRTLLPGWSATSLPIHLVCPPERRETAKVRAFGDHAARALAASRIG